MKTSEIITAILAIYASIVSTLSLLLQFRSKKWTIIITPSLETRGNEKFVAFQAMNLGERTVTLRSFFIHIPARKQTKIKRLLRYLLVVPIFRRSSDPGGGFYSDSLVSERDGEFPFDLTPGKAFRISVYQSSLFEQLKEYSKSPYIEFRGQVQDELGNAFDSSSLFADLYTKEVHFVRNQLRLAT